jgi:HEAT repeat protein
LLRDYDWPVQHAAVGALQRLRMPVRALLIHLVSDPNPTVRSNAVESLGHLRDYAVLDTLRHAMHDTDWVVRLAALEALARVGVSSEDVDLYIAALDDPQGEVRALGAEFLHTFGDDGAIDPLLHAARHDPDIDVQHNAIFALGAVGDERALETLRWLRDYDPRLTEMGHSIAHAAEVAIQEIEAWQRGERQRPQDRPPQPRPAIPPELPW